MGLVVKQSRIVAIQNEIAAICRLSLITIKKHFSKDAMEKELCSMQSEMLKTKLIIAARRLRDLNPKAYLVLKSEIEDVYKKLVGCCATKSVYSDVSKNKEMVR